MVCELKIETFLRKGKPVSDRYATAPFRIMNVNHDAADSWLRYMIMSSSPGILDGDNYRIRIHVGAGTSLEVQTQAYQRIYQMQPDSTGADQIFNVTLEENANFRYLPHPSVPHFDSTFKNTNHIDMAKTATLLWSEIITCGRKVVSDEVFTFKLFRSLTAIYCEGVLLFKDNLFLAPALIDMATIGQFEGYTHQGMLFYYSPNGNATILTNQIQLLLEASLGDSDAQFGVSNASDGVVVCRVLGMSGEEIFDTFKKVATEIEANTNSITNTKVASNN